jgi:hypothetical protein
LVQAEYLHVVLGKGFAVGPAEAASEVLRAREMQTVRPRDRAHALSSVAITTIIRRRRRKMKNIKCLCLYGLLIGELKAGEEALQLIGNGPLGLSQRLLVLEGYEGKKKTNIYYLQKKNSTKQKGKKNTELTLDPSALFSTFMASPSGSSSLNCQRYTAERNSGVMYKL